MPKPDLDPAKELEEFYSFQHAIQAAVIYGLEEALRIITEAQSRSEAHAKVSHYKQALLLGEAVVTAIYLTPEEFEQDFQNNQKES